MSSISALDWINGIDASIFAIDEVGVVTMWNLASESLFGYTSEEILEVSLSSLAFNDDDFVEKLIADKDSSAVNHVTLKAKDGSPVSLRINTSVQRDPSGRFISLVCFAEKLDILNDYQISRLRADQHANDTSVMLFSVNSSGDIDGWNQVTAEATGYTTREAIGNNLRIFLLRPFRDDFRRQSSTMRVSGESTFNSEFCAKSGIPLPLLISSAERLDPDGHRIGTLFAAHHAPEIVSNEKLIEAISFSMLIESANTPIFAVDVNGDVNEWNVMMVKVTGYSKVAAFDSNFVDTFVGAEMRTSFQEIVDRGLRGCGTSMIELQIRTVDGDTRHLVLNASSRRNILGKLVGVFFFAHDITELVRHYRTTEAMVRALRQRIDSSTTPMFGIDVNGMVNEWNDAIAEITGYNAEEAFNQPFVETFIVQSLQQSVIKILDIASTG